MDPLLAFVLPKTLAMNPWSQQLLKSMTWKNIRYITRYTLLGLDIVQAAQRKNKIQISDNGARSKSGFSPLIR